MSLFGRRIAQLALVVVFAAAVALACGGDGDPEPAVTRSAASQQAAEQAQAQANDTAPQSSQRQESTASRRQAQEQRQQETQAARSQSEPETGDQTQQQQQQGQQQQQAVRTDDAQVEPSVGNLSLSVRPILGGYQFDFPIEMLQLADGSFLVAELRGYITRFVEEDGEIAQFGVLDLTEAVLFRGEQGLLSMALHPNLEREPYLYVYYSPRSDGVSRLSRFLLVQGAALPASELIILEVDQPYPNHNGGAVRFGPDGMLYLGFGDGGAANDPHGHGQNRETLLGTIIRIDVNEIDASTPYRIPPDNPFVGVEGVRPEIYAWGLRNPWRMAFDSETGELWVGDVGQNRREEIAIVRAGENHGWNVFEGDECFGAQEDCDALGDAVAPVATYGRDRGCSVTGGEVYRGRAIPQLNGHYIFGDYCSSNIWTITPDGSMELRLELDDRIASFAADNEGEVYVLVFNGPIFKIVAE